MRSHREPEAQRLCEEILAQVPGHADALHVLSLLARDRGDLDAAIGYIRQVHTTPSLPERFHRDAAEILNNAAAALIAKRRLGRARAYCEEARALAPLSPEINCNAALVLSLLGEAEAAMTAAECALASDPRFVEAYLVAAMIEARRYRFLEALSWLERAAAIDPSEVRVQKTRADVLVKLLRPEDALTAASAALALDPRNPGVHFSLGYVMRALGRDAEALDSFERAALLQPERTAQALVNKGAVLIELGRLDEARGAIEAAKAASPNDAAAWHTMTKLKTFAPGDPDLEQMEDSLESGACEALDDRILLHFALGKAWLDAGDIERAFVYLDEGNRLHRSLFFYDVGATQRRFKDVMAALGALFDPRRATGPASDRPIFVVGMPRSGTTLVEQILASHSRVHGAGELNTLSRLVPPDRLLSIDPTTLGLLGEGYLAATAAIAPTSIRIIDKMPGNFIYLPLIAMALPSARIIHCRRDPLEICFSCYAQYFEHGHLFSFDQVDLGCYYCAYDEMMRAWREMLSPRQFMEIRYEDVVADLSGAARRLVEFCGLDWEDGCLAFHATDRPVRTASAVQVRRPIYTSSLARAQAYRRFLQALVAALGV